MRRVKERTGTRRARRDVQLTLRVDYTSIGGSEEFIAVLFYFGDGGDGENHTARALENPDRLLLSN